MDGIRFLLVASSLGVCLCMNTWDIPYGNLLDHVTPELDYDWISYKRTYNKTYDVDTEELTRRLYWEDNKRYILDHNRKFEAGESTFELGENHMADMAEDEIKKTYLSGLIVPEEEPEGPWYPEEPLDGPFEGPLEKDWRSEGYVTPVHQQGRCGSCWTFSAVGALEGMNKKKTGRLVDLSEQDLLDCSRSGNHGCGGGWMNNAFNHVKSTGGIDTETCYPYKGVQYRCSSKASCRTAATRGHYNVRQNDENSLTTAISKIGPIAVATDANQRSFMFYRGGVYYELACYPNTPPSHAMTAVGYGASGYGDYYIIKNSWGTGWGQSGYAFMARNKGNNCRIASYASFPV